MRMVNRFAVDSSEKIGLEDFVLSINLQLV